MDPHVQKGAHVLFLGSAMRLHGCKSHQFSGITVCIPAVICSECSDVGTPKKLPTLKYNRTDQETHTSTSSFQQLALPCPYVCVHCSLSAVRAQEGPAERHIPAAHQPGLHTLDMKRANSRENNIAHCTLEGTLKCCTLHCSPSISTEMAAEQKPTAIWRRPR